MKFSSILTSRGRRKRSIQRALQQKTKLGVSDFGSILPQLFQTPELDSEDHSLIYDLFQAIPGSISGKGDALSIQAVAEHLGKFADILAQQDIRNYDISSVYLDLAKSSVGVLSSAAVSDLAIKGFYCAIGTELSRSLCIHFLTRRLCFTAEAQKAYDEFIESPPNQQALEQFLDILQDIADVSTTTHKKQIEKLITPNTYLAKRFDELTWPKKNLGIAYLINGEISKASEQLSRAYKLAPDDRAIVEAYLVLLILSADYGRGIQVIENVRKSGLMSSELNVLSALCLAKQWLLQDREIEARGGQILKWLSALKQRLPFGELIETEKAYVTGRLEAIQGDLSVAEEQLRLAYESDSQNSCYIYHYVHLLQLRTKWSEAGKILSNGKVAKEEVLCLALRQAAHSQKQYQYGLDRLENEVAKLSRERDESAIEQVLLVRKYWFLSKHFDKVRPLPADVELASPEQSEEWMRIRLSCALASGDMEASKALLADGIFQRLTMPERHFYNGVYQWLCGNSEEALEEIQTVLDVLPEHAGALCCAAAIWADKREYVQAENCLAKAKAAEPTDHRIALRHAVMAWRQGNTKEAEQGLRAVIGSHGDIGPLASLWLARLYLMQVFDALASYRKGNKQSRLAKKGIQKTINNAEKHLEMAMEAGIPNARMYRWLCDAYKIFPWDSELQARSLLDELPRKIEDKKTCDVVEYTAALISTHTQDAQRALNGCRMLFEFLKPNKNQKPEVDNFVEALWRTSECMGSPETQVLFWRYLNEIREHSPQLAKATADISKKVASQTMVSLALTGDTSEVEEVEAEIDKRIDSNVGDSLTRFTKANLLIKRAELSAARSILECLLEDEDKLHAYLFMALCDLQEGNMESCRTHMEVVEARMSDADASADIRLQLAFLRAAIYLSEDDNAGAAKVLGEIAPDIQRLGQISVAELAAFFVSYSAAELGIKQIIQRLIDANSSGDPTNLQTLARCAAITNAADKALQLYEQALANGGSDELKTEFVEYLCYLSSQEFSKGNTGAALQKLEQVLSIAR